MTPSCCRSGSRTASRWRTSPHFLSSRTVADTLEHAILDAPMFQARWRWNLNRSLMVLRFRNGRRNPPPIQRMESDDLLAAVFPRRRPARTTSSGRSRFPTTCWCARPSTTRCTRPSTSTASEPCSSVSSPARSVIHCRDTTEPSVLAHEIITARPYAFLDDEEAQNRRTNAVHLRRGPSCRRIWRPLARSSQDAIERVHAEIAPDLETADDLHDLLSSTVLLRPRVEWSRHWLELVDRGRGQVVVNDGVALWTTTEGFSAAPRPRLRVSMPRWSTCCAATWSCAASRLAEALSIITTLPADEIAVGLAALEHEGSAMQGRYRAGARGTEWVARRLLARMHSYSKRSRREGFEPVTAQDFMRFLLRWQHVAPDTQLSGGRTHRRPRATPGLRSRGGRLGDGTVFAPDPPVSAGLAGCAVPRRGGRLAAAHAARVRRAAAPSAATPSKATPTAVVLRADLGWLLAAARASGESAPSVNGATGEVLGGPARARRVLRQRPGRRDPTPVRGRGAGAVGWCRAGPGHVRWLCRDPCVDWRSTRRFGTPAAALLPAQTECRFPGRRGRPVVAGAAGGSGAGSA